MKNVTGLIVAALTGAIVSVGTYTYLDKKNGQLVEQVYTAPIQRVNYPMAAPEGSVNFVEAANNSIHSVVHIKTKVARSSYRSSNPFYQYFFDQGLQPQTQQGSGSGVIISGDGYILTNNHVVSNADEVEVMLNDQRSYKAEVLGTDPNTDLALLKIDEEGLAFIPYGNSENVQVGEWVLAVGNPFNLNSTVTAGIVSAKGRNINILQEEFAIESFIQTDAAVNPGNSGGALVNTKGELIGINTAIASTTGSYAGYSFAVPVNIARKVVDDILEFGTVQRAFIGVSIRDLNGKIASEKGLNVSEGAYVQGLTRDGAAYDAGIREGDIIVAIDAVKVKNVPGLQEKIGSYRPGDMAQVTVSRDGQLRKFDVELRNKNGDTEVISKDADFMVQLGADLQPASAEQLKRFGLQSGLQVKNLANGKLKGAGVKEGFIITRVDRKLVQSPNDVLNALNKKTGGVLIEGVYPNGLTAYYGFGM
ncbi:MAG: trypsin-like peptidase domain-containing protein [Flavobacteriales bacterium]|nr:trypsin-like peptidase domain-containing protein [Flavobacteriales bacterium]